MPKITIYQALQEVKILEDRIQKLKNEIQSRPIGIVVGTTNNVSGTILSKDAFEADLKSKMDKKRDIEKNLQILKAQIAIENVTNEVSVGNKKYTPIQLINMTSKAAIEEKRAELAMLQRAYNMAEQEYNKLTIAAHSKAVEATKAFLPTSMSTAEIVSKLAELSNPDVKIEETNVFKNGEFTATCISAYRETLNLHLPTIGDPLKLKEYVEKETEKLDEFYRDANTALTVFNIQTEIEY